MVGGPGLGEHEEKGMRVGVGVGLGEHEEKGMRVGVGVGGRATFYCSGGHGC